MYYKLFLDDERFPKQVYWVSLPNDGPWVIVRNYDHFVKYIKAYGLPGFVTFDHDLALEHYTDYNESKAVPPEKYKEKTGYDCAKWLVDYCIQHQLEFPEFQVHSMNPIGKENIINHIKSYKKQLTFQNKAR